MNRIHRISTGWFGLLIAATFAFSASNAIAGPPKPTSDAPIHTAKEKARQNPQQSSPQKPVPQPERSPVPKASNPAPKVARSAPAASNPAPKAARSELRTSILVAKPPRSAPAVHTSVVKTARVKPKETIAIAKAPRSAPVAPNPIAKTARLEPKETVAFAKAPRSAPVEPTPAPITSKPALRVNHLSARAYHAKYNNTNYYYDSGIFYQQDNSGYCMVPAPIGFRVPWLPFGASIFYIDNRTYYFYYDTYYLYDSGSNVYIVVEKPAASEGDSDDVFDEASVNLPTPGFDRIQLVGGSLVEGIFLGSSSQTMELEVGSDTLHLQLAEVVRIDFAPSLSYEE